MISDVKFGDMICQEIASHSSKDQSVKYLGNLIGQLAASRKVQELYIGKNDMKATEAMPPSQEHIDRVARIAVATLFGLDPSPGKWDRGSVNTIVEKSMQNYWQQWKRDRNGDCLLIELNSPSEESCSLVIEWIEEGANATSYEIYQTLFKNQNQYTAAIASALLERNYTPDENNIHSVLVHESDHTFDILKLLASKKYLTPTCLTFALRYCRKNMTKIVKLLLQEEVVPDLYHLSFARKHLSDGCQRMLEKALRNQRDDSKKRCLEDEFFFIESQPSVRSLPDLDSVIENPDEESLSHLICHVNQGSQLTKGQFNKLVSKNKRFSLELLRVYFMFGFKLSERQISRLVEKRSSYLPAIIVLARLYGLEVTDEFLDNLMEKNKVKMEEKAINAFLKNIRPCSEVMEVKVVSNVINEYVNRAPGLFELLIQSGVHPSLDLLESFCKIPKIDFFKQLIENEPLFESNSRNQKLLEIAIETSKYEIIRGLIDKGFILNIEHVKKAILHQPLDVSKKLSEEYKKSGNPPCSSYKPKKRIYSLLSQSYLDDPIALVLLNQDKKSCGKLKSLFSEGEKPTQRHLDMVLNYPTIHTPDLIFLLEENGVAIESI